MDHDPTLIATIEQRLHPLERARPALRRKIVLGALLVVVLGVAALPAAAFAAGGIAWLLHTYVSDSVLSAIIGFPSGVALVAYATYRVVRPLAKWGAALQLTFGERWRDEVEVPLVREALRGVRVTPDSSLDHAAFQASRLFSGSSGDEFVASLGFSGSNHGIAWRAGRINVHRTTVNRQENRANTSWRMRGWYVHMEHAAPYPGTVRLVDKPVYTTFVPGYSNLSRASQVVRIDSGVSAFDAVGLVLLDEKHRTLPPLPPGLLEAWVAVRERLGRPIFLSLNAGGTYFAVATGDGMLPLDYRWMLPNRPERLAADVITVRQLPWAIAQFTEALASGAENR